MHLLLLKIAIKVKWQPPVSVGFVSIYLSLTQDSKCAGLSKALLSSEQKGRTRVRAHVLMEGPKTHTALFANITSVQSWPRVPCVTGAPVTKIAPTWRGQRALGLGEAGNLSGA